MKILVVLACLALGSAALAGGGDVFSKPRDITSISGGGGDVFAPSPKGHGGVFSKPREVISTAGGHGDVFTPVAN